MRNGQKLRFFNRFFLLFAKYCPVQNALHARPSRPCFTRIPVRLCNFLRILDFRRRTQNRRPPFHLETLFHGATRKTLFIFSKHHQLLGPSPQIFGTERKAQGLANAKRWGDGP